MSIAVLVAPQASADAAHVVKPVPAAAMRLCAAAHVSCAGHWTRIGGRPAYELGTRFAFRRDGRIVPLVQGCNSSGYCTTSNVGGGKCWSDNQVSGNGVRVVLNDCNAYSPGQLWKDYISYWNCSGGCLIWAVAYDGRCLNDPYGTSNSGTQIQMWDCYTTTYEQFRWENVGPNNSQLIMWVDGTNACLSDDGNSSSGAPLVIETCNGGSNQRWVW